MCVLLNTIGQFHAAHRRPSQVNRKGGGTPDHILEVQRRAVDWLNRQNNRKQQSARKQKAPKVGTRVVKKRGKGAGEYGLVETVETVDGDKSDKVAVRRDSDGGIFNLQGPQSFAIAKHQMRPAVLEELRLLRSTTRKEMGWAAVVEKLLLARKLSLRDTSEGATQRYIAHRKRQWKQLRERRERQRVASGQPARKKPRRRWPVPPPE